LLASSTNTIPSLQPLARNPKPLLNACRFFDCILSRGNTLDPAEGFRRFRGRDVDQHALLVKRGFA